jgi:hypothetical protein
LLIIAAALSLTRHDAAFDFADYFAITLITPIRYAFRRLA